MPTALTFKTNSCISSGETRLPRCARRHSSQRKTKSVFSLLKYNRHLGLHLHTSQVFPKDSNNFNLYILTLYHLKKS